MKKNWTCSAAALEQWWIPHCTWCMSPLSDRPVSSPWVSTNEQVTWIRCVWLRCAVLGSSRNVVENHCIRANISIMLHKTIYEINITLLFRTHFKPPSSVCNNFLLRSHVEFGRLLLLKYAIYSSRNEHFRCTHSSKPYPIVIMCLWSYIIYIGCCHVYFCCVKALRCMLWLKLTLFVMLQPPLRS